MEPKKSIVFFVMISLTCTAVFSQSNSASRLTYTEIENAALKSDRDYRTTWHGTQPPGWKYGEYEIPPQYWADAIKELKPLKLYDHLLNVAVVLKIRNGTEEGIYVRNLISSYMGAFGSADESGFEFTRSEEGSFITFKRYKVPRFEDYPVTDIFTGTPALPQIFPSSEQDMEKIKTGVEKGVGVFHGNTEKVGANFAGHFVLIKWSCGFPCLAMAMVDAETGDVFPPPDTNNCNVSFNLLTNLTYPGKTPQNPEVQFRVDSSLLTITNSSVPGIPYTFYYQWQGNRWKLLRRAPLQRTESDSQKTSGPHLLPERDP